MGRRPNALILQWFDRGPKLNDASNRYPHTCKACGESFPKGRIDSLTNHLKKRCPAISESDRLNVWLTFGQSTSVSQRMHNYQNVPQQNQAQMPLPDSQANSAPVDMPTIERDWTALETLAEVSRRMDLSEKRDDRGRPESAGASGHSVPLQQPAAEMNEPLLAEGVELKREGQQQIMPPGHHSSPIPAAERPTEERVPGAPHSDNPSANDSAISMAAAATAAAAAARLNTSLLDPQLMSEDLAVTSVGRLDAVTSTADPTTPHPTSSPHDDATMKTPPTAEGVSYASPSSRYAAGNSPSQPWGEITYTADTFPAIAPNNDSPQTTPMITKHGFRMDQPSLQGALTGSRGRHARARFDPKRRREVQEVRKLGACIRCRILRKTCSKGSPCDTCRKVLAPRIWRSGCVRTKFSEQLDLYSAGVQIVLAQGRINNFKTTMTLRNYGVIIEACHFPEMEARLELQVLQSGQTTSPENGPPGLSTCPIVMIDNDAQDVPMRVELYMRAMLRTFIEKETSHFAKVTLQTACQIADDTNDELLKKALELWGLTEMLDRERQWKIRVKVNSPGDEIVDIDEQNNQEVFTTFCLQLAAAAERKAAAVSKSLLISMQRVLQDSKIKIDFGIYYATLVLLHCVEKSTWAFKAWEQPNLRPLWPLEKDPGSFTHQGHIVADLLRMLLGIRKALPRTACREGDGMLVTEEQDPTMQRYFTAIGLKVADVKNKLEKPDFQPTDPRSFVLLFCSTLLLPSTD